jgi:hypothetical protein
MSDVRTRRLGLACLGASMALSVHAQFDNAPSPSQPNNPIDEAAEIPVQDHGDARFEVIPCTPRSAVIEGSRDA